MNRISLFLLALGALYIAGCNNDTTSTEASASNSTTAAPSVTSAHGAWLGEGNFTATEGTQQITAQLELLADGTYRFMVIEPRVLMMVVGLEKGNWQLSDQQLNLMPTPDQTSEGAGKLGALNSAPKNFRPKSLSIEDGAFRLKDAQMDLLFTPNLTATEKLRERGEL